VTLPPETENTLAGDPTGATVGDEGWSNREEARQATVAEVIAHHEMVSAYLQPVITAAGRVPELGSPEWCRASESARNAAVFVYAKRHLDHIGIRAWASVDKARVADVERLTAQRMASYAVSEAENWISASKRPSYAELTRRRAVVD